MGIKIFFRTVCVILILMALGACGYPQNFSATSVITESEDVSIPTVFENEFYRSEQDDLIGIDICFPQIRSELYPASSNSINSQIYDYVIAPEYRAWQDTRLNVEIAYEITFISEQYLSILFHGFHSDNGKVRYIDSTFVCDIRTGSVVSLSDFVDCGELLDILHSNELLYTITQFDDTESKDALPEEGKKFIEQEIEEFLLSENRHQNDFFIGKNEVGILIFPDYATHHESTIIRLQIDWSKDQSRSI